jgi:hypothetical protein
VEVIAWLVGPLATSWSMTGDAWGASSAAWPRPNLRLWTSMTRDESLDTEPAYAALGRQPIPQWAALTLRYLDGLPVAVVAEVLNNGQRAMLR